MKLGKVCAALSAAAFAASMAAIPCSAAALEADENGIYGQAGIVWMIRDQWDHRKDIGADYHPTDEMETKVISCTHKDVNITGNGTYTVEMSGYHCPDEFLDAGWEAGYLGVECTLNFEDNEDLSMELDEAVIDGVTYTFTKGLDEEGERIQPLEDPEVIEDGNKLIKIKNGYGNNIVSEPEMDAKCWKTTDPITVTFTISGLPTDKIEGFDQEDIVIVYGNGSIDNDPPEEDEEEAAEAEDTEETAEDGADGADAAEEDAAAGDAPAETAAVPSTPDAEDDTSSNAGIIVGVVAAVAVIAGVAVVAVKKKK